MYIFWAIWYLAGFFIIHSWTRFVHQGQSNFPDKTLGKVGGKYEQTILEYTVRKEEDLFFTEKCMRGLKIPKCKKGPLLVLT